MKRHIKEKQWAVIALFLWIIVIILGHADPVDYYHWSESLP